MTDKDMLPFLVTVWAYKYRNMGWNVIPLYDHKKAPLETPWEKFQEKPSSTDEFDKWFGNPPPNLTGTALIMGKSSGVMAVDEDLYDSPNKVFHLESKMVSQTASGGRHKIYKDNPAIDKHGLTGIELKNLGNIIVLPPSVVVKKPYVEKKLGQYKWLRRCPLEELSTLSPTDFEKYRKASNSNAGSAFTWDDVPGSTPGSRHNTLMSAAMHLWNQVILGRMGQDTAWTMFIAANKSFEYPKEDIAELKRIFTDACNYVYKNPPNKNYKSRSFNNTTQQNESKVIPRPKKAIEVGKIRIKERDLEKTAPSTGYPELDELIRGFQPKHLLAFTGDTNIGKTGMCANFSVRVSAQGKKVLYIALEPDTLIAESLASARTSKKYEDLTDDDITHDDHNIDIYTNEIRTMEDLKLAISQLNQQTKYDLVIIDHIGYFVRGSGEGAYIQEQANLLKDLATFANDQLFAILIVAHLRKPDKSKKKDRVPTMDDISGSAAFKQDSDEVLILTRSIFPNENGITVYKDEGFLIVAKTKSTGGNGVVNVIFSNRSAFITTVKDSYEPLKNDNKFNQDEPVKQQPIENENTSREDWQGILDLLPQNLLSEDFQPHVYSDEQLNNYKQQIIQAINVIGEVRTSAEFSLLLNNQSKINKYLKT